jgi:hypothetical protein
MDSSLVALVSVLCSKLGVEPSSLDAVMLHPTSEEKMRFKAIETTPIHQLRARFAIIKYLNRLVTPLLSYVDIRMMTEEASAEEFSQFDTHSLSYQIHSLREVTQQ